MPYGSYFEGPSNRGWDFPNVAAQHAQERAENRQERLLNLQEQKFGLDLSQSLQDAENQKYQKERQDRLDSINRVKTRLEANKGFQEQFYKAALAFPGGVENIDMSDPAQAEAWQKHIFGVADMVNTAAYKTSKDLGETDKDAGINASLLTQGFLTSAKEPQQFVKMAQSDGFYPGESSTSANTPMSVKEFQFYQGLPQDKQEEFKALKRASPEEYGRKQRAIESEKTAAMEQRIPIEAETKGAETASTEIQKYNQTQYDTAIAAEDNISKINELINQIENSDAITGMGANVLKNIERAKALIGDKVASGKASETEILDAMMGSEVFPMIKSLGVGARGLDTPAEREFMRAVLTGSITLQKSTLLRMAEIRKNIAQRAIDRWNDRTDSGELNDWYKATKVRKRTLGIQEKSGEKDYSNLW